MVLVRLQKLDETAWLQPFNMYDTGKYSIILNIT